ncbi:carboxypeptidase M32 [Rhodobacterales bacterium HKCCE2091]|nr:carboxypeptidase M32 [Rhodobacterales bacterium HKCCE2091]
MTAQGTAKDALFAHDAGTAALDQVMMRLHWDQETVMPRGAADQRAEEIAALETVIHARRMDPRLADWLAEAEPADAAEAARIRWIAEDHGRAVRLPADLAAELARMSSLGQGRWVEARKAEDVAGFLPVLERIVALQREAGAAMAAGGDAYDALLAGYEPDITAAEIAEIFGRMRPRLVDLKDRVLASGRQVAELKGPFDTAAQLALTARVAQRFGYDMDHGRIDLAVHPFSSGSGADVRITTRVDEADPLGCLYSTIHETGHAAYEQHVDPAYRLTRLGKGVSMGVHESQSRIYENQLGRGRAFCGWLFGEMQTEFGDIGVPDADAFYAAVNRVHRGFIRTESDELHYNLHIMMRFDLERALIAGDLAVGDLEAAWNDRFEADFGVPVPAPSKGMLQDVHWSAGLFGYFPTYSLGNVYAGCLFAAMKADLPGLEGELASGDLGPATAWLAEKVQRHGASKRPRTVIEEATGTGVTEGPLLDYLEAKFGALYGV